jgi:phosphomannomutase
MGDLTGIFKAYDVRGVVPTDLNPERARAIGTAVALFLGSQAMVVGRDMRSSGLELMEAFKSGLVEQGCSVVDIGLCSTDLLYFASGRLDLPGAMFTASHNPARYNGIKMCRAGALPIGVETGLTAIRDLAEAELVSPSSPAPQLGTVSHRSMLGEFVEHVVRFTGPTDLSGMLVVADTANGMGGLVVPPVMDALGVRYEVLYPELDGDFPNHPADPIDPANLVDLRDRVTATGASIGLAFDGDADRVFLVDDLGAPISGSLTTAMVAMEMLNRHPGATILYNLICSQAVPELISEAGGRPVRTRVGHSFIKAVMAETGAVFGGEHSGHYYFADNYRADSGLIAAVVVLGMLGRQRRPLSELRKEFERYEASGEVNMQVEDPVAVIEKVADHFRERGSCDLSDGLTVKLGELPSGWWFNLRPSNTEPLLRLNLEAGSRAAVEEHLGELERLIGRLSGGGE